MELTATLMPMQDGTTPLYMASFKNSVEIIQLLLASGAKVNLGRKVRVTVGELDFNKHSLMNLQVLAYQFIITSCYYNMLLVI